MHDYFPYMLGELGIYLWDVYWITRLPIVGVMYDEFFPANKLILDKNSLPLRALSRSGHVYSRGRITQVYKVGKGVRG